MSTIPVKSIIAHLQTKEKLYDLTAVRYEATINAWPTIIAEVLVKPSREKEVVNVDGTLVGELNALKDTVQPVTITFGVQGEETTISCIIRSLYFVISTNDIAIRLVLTPAYTKVDQLNLSIFKYRDGSTGDVDGIMTEYPKINKNTELMPYIASVYNKSKEQWGNSMNYIIPKLNKFQQKLIPQIHKRNEKVESLFTDLLTNSNTTVKDLYNIGDRFFPQDNTLAQEIYKCITQNNGTFLSTICSLGNLFKLIYVPGLDGENIGYFIPKSFIKDPSNKPDDSTSDLKLVSAEINMGGLGLPQLGYVYSEADSIKDIDNIIRVALTQDGASYPDLLQASDDELENKSCIRIAGPTWIPLYVQYQEAPSSGDPANGGRAEYNVSPETIQKVRDNITNILIEWCKQEYIFQTSATSYADVELFYSSSPKIFGKYVTITDNTENGNKVAEGFVSTYEQLVVKQGTSSGEVYTKIKLIGV